jgi:hypothetical protein
MAFILLGKRAWSSSLPTLGSPMAAGFGVHFLHLRFFTRPMTVLVLLKVDARGVLLSVPHRSVRLLITILDGRDVLRDVYI